MNIRTFQKFLTSFKIHIVKTVYVNTIGRAYAIDINSILHIAFMMFVDLKTGCETIQTA